MRVDRGSTRLARSRVGASLGGSALLASLLGVTALATTRILPQPLKPWHDFERNALVMLLDCGDELEPGVETTCSVVRAWKGPKEATLVVVSEPGMTLVGGGQNFLLFLRHPSQQPGRVVGVGPMNTDLVPLRCTRAVGEYLRRREDAERLSSDAERSEAFWAAMAELARSPDPLIQRWVAAELGSPRSPWNHSPTDLEPFVKLAGERGLREIASRASSIVLRAVEESPTAESQRMLARVLRGDPNFAAAFLRNFDVRRMPMAEPMLEWLRSIADDLGHPYSDVALQKLRDAAPGAPARTVDRLGVLSSFELELLPAATTQFVGEPVLIGVRVRNATTEALRVVPPFVGSSVKIQVLREDGTELPFLGETLRPTSSRATQVLRPGEGVTHVVAVASAFPMGTPGRYSVRATYEAPVPANEHFPKARGSDDFVERTVATAITMLAPATEADRAGAAAALDARGLVEASTRAWTAAPRSAAGQGALVATQLGSPVPDWVIAAYRDFDASLLAPHYQGIARAEHALALIAAGQLDEAGRVLAGGETSPLMVDAVRKALRASEESATTLAGSR